MELVVEHVHLEKGEASLVRVGVALVEGGGGGCWGWEKGRGEEEELGSGGSHGEREAGREG